MASQVNPARLWWARWGVLLLLAMASLLAYLTRHSLAVANTTIQLELGINNEQFGYLYGAFSLGYMLFQIPGGWVGQRMGVRLALPLMAVLWSLMTFGTAFMPTFAGLLFVRFLFGLAQAGLVPSQALAVRDWMSVGGRGVASSVMVVAMSVGSIASLSLTSWLMRESPWRSIFVGYSTLGVVWAVLFVILYRSNPHQVRWLRRANDDSFGEPPDALVQPLAKDIDELPAVSAYPSRDEPKRHDSSSGPGFLRLLSSRSMWGLAVQALLKAAGYNLTVTFLPALLEYIYHVPPENTGWLVTWSLLTFVAGSMLGGVLVDLVYRLTGSKFVSRSGLAAVMLILAAVFTSIAGYTDSASSTAVWLALGALFAGLGSAPPWVAVMDVGGKHTAVIMGFMNSFAALSGVVLSPLVGRLVDHTQLTSGNWSLVFLLHGGYYLLAAIAWLTVDPNRSLDSSGVTHAV